MSEHDSEKAKPIHTRAGTSDGEVGNGESLTGKAGPDDQAEATDFYEEIGAMIQGKESDEIHEPSMEEDEEN